MDLLDGPSSLIFGKTKMVLYSSVRAMCYVVMSLFVMSAANDVQYLIHEFIRIAK